jgi:Putative MetA-pathway of phenol degradation
LWPASNRISFPCLLGTRRARALFHITILATAGTKSSTSTSTPNIFGEINTKNTITQYRSGDILHAEFTATKSTGKWTVGPVAYYGGQVTDDQSSAFYGGAINVNRYNIWAVGASLGYTALDEVSANASRGTPQLAPGPTITEGFTAFAQLSYRLWASDEPVAAPKSPLYHK